MHFHFHHTNKTLPITSSNTYIAIFVPNISLSFPLLKIIITADTIPMVQSPHSTIMLCIVKHEITMCWILTSIPLLKIGLCQQIFFSPRYKIPGENKNRTTFSNIYIHIYIYICMHSSKSKNIPRNKLHEKQLFHGVLHIQTTLVYWLATGIVLTQSL